MNLAAKIQPALPKSLLGVLRKIFRWSATRIALRHAVREAPPAWAQDFANARVLVVGTGPSLDRVTDDYFAGFDVLVCINHAILGVPEHRCVYYFSTDVPRTREVMQADGGAKIDTLPIERRVLVLSFVRIAPHRLYRLSSWLRRFTLVRNSAYHFKSSAMGQNRLIFPSYEPKGATDTEVLNWINGAGHPHEKPFPRASSASCAMVFAARFRPAEIRLIGVDLNAGRAEGLQEVAGARAFFGPGPVKNYRRLEGVIRGCGIPVENDSWAVTPEQ